METSGDGNELWLHDYGEWHGTDDIGARIIQKREREVFEPAKKKEKGLCFCLMALLKELLLKGVTEVWQKDDEQASAQGIDSDYLADLEREK